MTVRRYCTNPFLTFWMISNGLLQLLVGRLNLELWTSFSCWSRTCCVNKV